MPTPSQSDMWESVDQFSVPQFWPVRYPRNEVFAVRLESLIDVGIFNCSGTGRLEIFGWRPHGMHCRSWRRLGRWGLDL